MRVTRKRWDTYCVVGAVLLLLPTSLEILDGNYLRGAVAPLAVIPLVLLRFLIPVEGYEATPIRMMAIEYRRLILWICIVSMLTPFYLVIAFALGAEGLVWAFTPVILPPTLWLAHRADKARRNGITV